MEEGRIEILGIEYQGAVARLRQMVNGVVVRESKAARREAVRHAVAEIPEITGMLVILIWKVPRHEITESLAVGAWPGCLWIKISTQCFGAGEHANEGKECSLILNQLRYASEIYPAEPVNDAANLRIHIPA